MFQGLATFLLIWSLAQGAFASQCLDLVSTLQGPLDSQAIDQKIQNLSELKLSLDLAKIEGKSSAEVTALAINYEQKEQVLVEYLEKNNIMTKNQLIERVKLKIAELQGQSNVQREEEAKRKKEQEQLIKELVIDGTRALSHRIKPGSFKMGKAGKEVDVTLTKPFDMMATATTQLFYRRVAELANTRFPGKYKITADPSQFKGDLHPVERVSYDEVQIWINALNDLSKVGELTLLDLIPGHKQGDVYRLPTEAEWEFVIRGRGTLNETYHFGNQKSDLKTYAWYYENAGSTQQVAQKKPLIFDGKEFYDMYGNVSEWVVDTWDGHSALPGGTDPISQSGPHRMIRGGGWNTFTWAIDSGYRTYPKTQKNGRTASVGFRLVRTVE